MIYEQDGDKICCHDEQFINLQESVAGFGDTEEEALEDFCKEQLKALGWKWCNFTGHGTDEVVTEGEYVVGDIEKEMILVPPRCFWDEPEKISDFY